MSHNIISMTEGPKKGKQFASSTTWGLGGTIVLQLMECLTPTFSFDIFMDNYFTSFRLLTHLGVNSIQVTEIDFADALSLEKQLSKKETWPL